MTSPLFAAGQKLTIVALGDSTTAGTPGFHSPREIPPKGFGNEESQYAYWIMKKRPYWKIINQGIRAQRTDQILARFDEDVAPFRPDYVIILAGVNDLFQGYGSEQVIRNLAAIYDKAESLKIKVVTCTILPYNEMSSEAAAEMEKANGWIRQSAEKRHFIFCDTFHLLEDPLNPGHLAGSPDGYHPDVSGYRKMGESIAVSMEADE